VFDNLDSDHEFYESAEDFGEAFEPEDQDGEQAGGPDIDIPINHAVC
jgi:hypothetical protein